MRFLSACVWYAQDACYLALAQTVKFQASHEKSECIAGARPARGLRGGGAPSVLHQGGRGALSDPVGGEPADQGARGPARRGALPAAPPRARAHRRRPVVLRFRGAGPHHHARRYGPAARAGGKKRPVGHHHALVRGPVAHSASRRLHAQPPRDRRAHHGRHARAGSRPRRARSRRTPRPGVTCRLERGAADGRARLSRVQPEAGEEKSKPLREPRTCGITACCNTTTPKDAIPGCTGKPGSRSSASPTCGPRARFRFPATSRSSLRRSPGMASDWGARLW